MIDFLDSSIVPTAPGVHEVYLLMPYHKARPGSRQFCSVVKCLKSELSGEKD